MTPTRSATAVAALMALGASPVTAETDIQFWHALGGALGEKIEEIAAEGAIKPVQQVMDNTDLTWDADAYLPAVKSYYTTTTDGALLSQPFNSSTPVLWYNRDLLGEAGIKDVPQTWNEMFAAVDKLQAAGHECAFSITLAVSGWIARGRDDAPGRPVYAFMRDEVGSYIGLSDACAATRVPATSIS